MTEQLRPDGSLRHLLTLETLSRAQIERLLAERAHEALRALEQVLDLSARQRLERQQVPQGSIRTQLLAHRFMVPSPSP